MFYPQRRTCPYARPQHSANALHRLAAHCHARQTTQSNLRALQPPMSETTPGTEPPYPGFAAHLRCVGAKEGKGSQEGTGNHVWCPVPFCPSPWARRPPAAEGGNYYAMSWRKPPSREGHHRLRRQAAGTAEGLPSAEGKEEKEAGTHSHFSQTSGQYPTVACLPFRTTGVFISVPSSSSFSFLSSS